MKFSGCLCLLALVLPLTPPASTAEAQVTWLVNNTKTIGGLPVSTIGDPQVISTVYGSAVWFNGVSDGLKLATNPVAGLTNFTVEMIFRPDSGAHPAGKSPRIFHIQSPSPPDHRLTLEARIVQDLWYGDTFLRTSDVDARTLADSNLTHSIGGWYQLTVTYDGARFRQYVNTALELEGALAVTALESGECSIGMRANTNSFFEGAVLALRFSGRVLATNEFLCVPKAVLEPPKFSRGRAWLDFRLSAGLPLGFSLERSDRVAGPWSEGIGSLLTTNAPGTSYRFTVPARGQAEFYRVMSP